MKNPNDKAIVGFSINPELYWEINPKDYGKEKMRLNATFWKLAGTSLNVVTAMRNFKKNAELLALTGNDDTNTVILNHLLSKSDISYKCYPILDLSNFAIMPDDVFRGRVSLGQKGNLNSDKIEYVLSEIEKLDARWRIATGVRAEEFKLAQSLLSVKSEGFRTLNPSYELIQNRPIFEILLKSADFLIMNMQEFRACEVTSPNQLHKYGPQLIVVTDEERGGIVSHVRFSEERFNAVNYVESNSPVYTKGAGDWFNGAFNAMCQLKGKPYVDLCHDDLFDFINFGAMVSGKKVTMNGSANGPTLKDL